jgi:hypothetical protein
MTTTMTRVIVCVETFLYKRCNVVVECLPLWINNTNFYRGVAPSVHKVWLQPSNALPFFPDCVVAEFVDRC